MKYQEWSLQQTCQMASGVMMEFMTGMLLVTGRLYGERAQAELLFRLQRTHQRQFFIPNLKLLGIDIQKDPPAVVCAKYHYLSNALGGIDMEYVAESPKRAWVRYRPPWPGYHPLPVITERAAVEGWHAYNGESLYSIEVKDGLKVGVVITQLPSAGDPVMELFFQEYDWDLAPEERCKYIPQPHSPASTHYGSIYLEMLRTSGEEWPEERVARGMRNYGRYYAADTIRGLLSLLGTAPACEVVAQTWRLMVAQHARAWKQELGIAETGAKGVTLFMKAMGEIQGDELEAQEVSPTQYLVRQRNCRLFPKLDVPGGVFQALNAFNEATAQALRCPVAGPRVKVSLIKSMADSDSHFEWQVRELD